MKKIFPTILIGFFLTGCGNLLVADPALLNKTSNTKPLTQSNFITQTTIESHIQNSMSGAGIKELVDDSLNLALKNANIFNASGTSQYIIKAHIEEASQATMSFGNFNGKMKIRYTVTSPKGNNVYNNTIYTEAGADKWSFAGAKRHARARVVNTAKNVSQFVEELNQKMKK